MKTRILTAIITILITSCTQTKTQEEVYDSITTKLYQNSYDSLGKLQYVSIQESKYLYIDGNYVLADVTDSKQSYRYSGDSCQITYTGEMHQNEIRTTTTSPMGSEELRVSNDLRKDTVKYWCERYWNKDKSKPEYRRMIYKSSGSPFTQAETTDDVEIFFYYNNNGVNIREIEHDYKRGKTKETYRFKDMNYEQAVGIVPKSHNKQNIICYAEKNIKDTLITQYQINETISYMTKLYNMDGKRIYVELDDSCRLAYRTSSYRVDSVDVEVKEMIQSGGSVDSIYSVKGRPIREVHISPSAKTITISEYDKRGNIVKQTYKSKYYDSISEEDVNNMLRIIQESKK